MSDAFHGTMSLAGTVPKDGPVTAAACALSSSCWDWRHVASPPELLALLLSELVAALDPLLLLLLLDEQAASVARAAAPIMNLTAALEGRPAAPRVVRCTKLLAIICISFVWN